MSRIFCSALIALLCTLGNAYALISQQMGIDVPNHEVVLKTVIPDSDDEAPWVAITVDGRKQKISYRGISQTIPVNALPGWKVEIEAAGERSFTMRVRNAKGRIVRESSLGVDGNIMTSGSGNVVNISQTITTESCDFGDDALDAAMRQLEKTMRRMFK